MEIMVPSTQVQLDQVRSLMRAFVAWHRLRHATDLVIIDQYFDEKGFEAELAGLPGKYTPPLGCLLLAQVDGQPAGCVALRAMDGGVCEMKRMFVDPHFQGRGVGRGLAEALIGEARQAGYSAMRLDTGPRQVEAQTLYHSLGFKDIGP